MILSKTPYNSGMVGRGPELDEPSKAISTNSAFSLEMSGRDYLRLSNKSKIPQRRDWTYTRPFCNCEGSPALEEMQNRCAIASYKNELALYRYLYSLTFGITGFSYAGDIKD